jgi:hypothetical protein
MNLAPVTLFVFNRPLHTRQTVEALLRNELASESDLIVFSDAPKSEAQTEAVREVRNYIYKIEGFKSVTIIERETNFGLARSIIEGVTSVVNEYGRIIVLEDDLIVTPHFLDFMNRALNKYEREAQVMQVSGYMFPVKLNIEDDALFLPFTTSWGWASWKRAWKLFDSDAKGYAQIKSDLALRRRFNLDGAYDYFAMLEAQLCGEINSWAIRWYLSVFMHKGLILYPPQTYVINAGFDGSGTHCGKHRIVQYHIEEVEEDERDVKFPEKISVLGFNYAAIIAFIQMPNSEKVIKKIKSFLKNSRLSIFYKKLRFFKRKKNHTEDPPVSE